MQSNGYLSPLPLDSDLRSLSPAERVRPGSSDLGADVLEPWGGKVGAHGAVGRQRFWTPLRLVMLVTALFLCFGFFSKAGCLETSHPADGSAPGLQWDGRQYYKACYSDLIPLYSAEGLSQGALPYKYMWVEGSGITRYMEYPVVTGMYQYVTMKFTKAWEAMSPGSPIEVIKYVLLACLSLAMFWMVAVWATYKSSGRRPWDTLFMAASPLVVFQAFTNFDTIAVACACVALMLWGRNKIVWSGVMFGIGIAAKLYPVFLFGALLVVAIRRRRLLPVVKAAAVAAGTWLVLNLPIMIPFPEGWKEFYRLNSTRGANPESIYNVLQDLTGIGWLSPGAGEPTADALNTVSFILFALCCVGVLVIGLTAARTPRVAQLGFLIVATFLLTNKVWSPQYSLWLVPLALLAIPSIRVLVPWMVVDALLWVAHMSYFQGPDKKGLDPEWFHSIVLMRDVLVVVVCIAVIRQIYRPTEDRVRMTHQGSPEGADPLAGPLADPSEIVEPDEQPRASKRGRGRSENSRPSDNSGATALAGAPEPGLPANPEN